MTKITPEILEEELEQLHEDGIPMDLIEEIRNKIKNEELEEEQLEYLLNKVYINYNNAIVEASEPVGTVAAQSIGEPGTQMSIPGTQKVIIKEGEITKIVQIGDFVDRLFSTTSAPMKDGKTEILNLNPHEFCVPSIGQDEKVHWGKLRQVSRHPAYGEILKITTRSGRTIQATGSHSFLKRKENMIKSVPGKSLKVKDRIPLVKSLPFEQALEKIAVEQYIPKNEAWYGSELAKATDSWNRLGREWKDEYNITYTVPGGIDGLRIAFKTNKSDVLEQGYVYPTAFSNTDIKIPECINLDRLFGWFLGAYLAEGTNAGSYVSIANVDKSYQDKVILFAERFSISSYIKEDTGEYGPSDSVVLSSSLLSLLLERMCGKGANQKYIPSWAINAPEEFISGFLQAYFDGDGNFSLKRMQIQASTNSRDLRDGICLLLSRFGIYSSKYRENEQYILRIPGKHAPIFREKIGSSIPKKKEKLIQMTFSENTKDVTYDIIDMIPGFEKILNDLRIKLQIDSHSSIAASIRKFTKKQEIGRQSLERYISILTEEASKQNVNIEEEIAILNRALNSDVIWDQIIAIELIKSPTPLLYDFSVIEYENFTTSEGLITHNTLRTFHYAGVEEFSVTQGLPRLIEIVDARRFPSTPQMTVYLEEPYSTSEDKAIKVHNRIEQIRIEQITSDVDLDFVNWQIIVNLIPEICERKGINIEDIPNTLKRYKKKGTIKREGSSIIIDPGIEDLQRLQKLREKILKKVVKGIRGVKRGLLTPSDDNKEWVIKTEGTNLSGVIQISGVDATRSVSNHLHEVEKLFGIEAARNMIIAEAEKVLEQQGLDVDLRHLLILSDLMCSTGTIQSIGRHGISGSKSSVFARAAFEVTVNQLLDAGLYGEEERLLGIPENVIVGQITPIGTGRVNVQFDLDRNLEILNKKNK
ncbi:MAG: DNA-directed RNA polymerase subunit A'' [Candidatus Lokiarchaeota archaeon]|nr:DNA-directed RNA polymerase subunit A'' [Candidatus Lokiarchaeota archaeon]MBD3200422.1 DNA-directed RNA polymerase subunit A'' [Candidatus Lokiarchaeota archaeon]